MKKIVLIASLFSLQTNRSFAQSAGIEQIIKEKKIDSNVLFASKANELDAQISRNNLTATQNTIADISLIMQNVILEQMKANNATKPNTSSDSIEKLKIENALATDFKMQSIDLIKNRKAITETLKKFEALIK